MKAIVVKYLGATNTKPARLKVTCEGVKSKVFSRSSLESDRPYREAAHLFCVERGWPGQLAEGVLPNGSYVYCFIPKP
jgi:hypothetical protein